MMQDTSNTFMCPNQDNGSFMIQGTNNPSGSLNVNFPNNLDRRYKPLSPITRRQIRANGSPVVKYLNNHNRSSHLRLPCRRNSSLNISLWTNPTSHVRIGFQRSPNITDPYNPNRKGKTPTIRYLNQLSGGPSTRRPNNVSCKWTRDFSHRLSSGRLSRLNNLSFHSRNLASGTRTEFGR